MIKKYVLDEVIRDDQQHQEMCQIQPSIHMLVMSWSHCLWKVNKGQTLDQYFIKSGRVTRDWHNMQHQSASKRIERNSKQYYSVCMDRP